MGAPGIGADVVRQVFVDAFKEARSGRGQALPPGLDFDLISDQLSRPWVRGFAHGLWELRFAVRVILDDAEAAAAAEGRLSSPAAKQRAAAYEQLLAAARSAHAAGVEIPEASASPPSGREHREAVGNPAHRDWRFVFGVVVEHLEHAAKPQMKNNKKSSCFGSAEVSIPVVIACNLLNRLGHDRVTAAGLSKMLKRGKKAVPRNPRLTDQVRKQPRTM